MPKLRPVKLGLLLSLQLVAVGCGSSIEVRPFSEFAESIDAAADAADSTAAVLIPEQRDRYLDQQVELLLDPSDEEGSGLSGFQLRFQGGAYAWTLDPMPFYLSGTRFQAAIEDANDGWQQYAQALLQLATVANFSEADLDSYASRVNGAFHSFGRTHGTAAGNSTELISASVASLFHGFIESRKKEKLTTALRDNQAAVEANARLMQEGCSILARLVQNQYRNESLELSSSMAVAANAEDRELLRRSAAAWLDLNERTIAQLETLQELADLYGGVPQAHRDLLRAVESEDSPLAAIRRLADEAKALSKRAKRIAPSAGD